MRRSSMYRRPNWASLQVGWIGVETPNLGVFLIIPFPHPLSLSQRERECFDSLSQREREYCRSLSRREREYLRSLSLRERAGVRAIHCYPGKFMFPNLSCKCPGMKTPNQALFGLFIQTLALPRVMCYRFCGVSWIHREFHYGRKPE